jgi:hypothetical protein
MITNVYSERKKINLKKKYHINKYSTKKYICITLILLSTIIIILLIILSFFIIKKSNNTNKNIDIEYNNNTNNINYNIYIWNNNNKTNITNNTNNVIDYLNNNNTNDIINYNIDETYINNISENINDSNTYEFNIKTYINLNETNNNINCKSGFYLTNDNNCKRCSVENCENCYGNNNIDICISCYSSFIPIYQNNIIKYCEYPCYENEKDKCLTYGNNKCSSCDIGCKLINGKCILNYSFKAKYNCTNINQNISLIY